MWQQKVFHNFGNGSGSAKVGTRKRLINQLLPHPCSKHMTLRSTYGLFPCAWARPILASQRSGCKIKLFPGSLLYVLQHHKLCENDGLRCCNKLFGNILDSQPARSDVKIGSARAHTHRLLVIVNTVQLGFL